MSAGGTGRIAALLAITVLAGCVTKGEGNKLRGSLLGVQAQLREIQKSVTDQKARLGDLTQKAEEKAQELRKLIDEATKLFQRNSTNFFGQIQELQTALRNVNARTDPLQRDIDVLRRDFEAFKALIEKKLKAPPPPPSDPNQALDACIKQVAAKQWSGARNCIIDWMRRNAGHSRMDEAQLTVGETHQGEANCRQALVEFKDVFVRDKKGPHACSALLKIAGALECLRDYTLALRFLKELTKGKHCKGTPAAVEGKVMISQIKQKEQ